MNTNIITDNIKITSETSKSSKSIKNKKIKIDPSILSMIINNTIQNIKTFILLSFRNNKKYLRFFALSDNLGLQIWADEYYTLVKGIGAPPFDKQNRETDLFAGITL